MGIVAVVTQLVLLWFNLIYFYVKAAFKLIFPPARKSIIREIALITGAGHGIGREFALEISKLGATVVLWDVNTENNERTAEEVKAAGGTCFAYTCDITSSSRIANCAEKVRQEVGDVTILVNNAGILHGGVLLDLSEADIRRTFEVNTLSHFWMVKEFLPSMMKKGEGHILNVVSMAGFSGVANLVDYCSSKYGALGFSESLISELREGGYADKIRVSILCPMFVDTGLVKQPVSGLTRILSPKETALAGIDGMLRNYEIITVPPAMLYSVKIGSLFPREAIKYLMTLRSNGIVPQYKKKE